MRRRWEEQHIISVYVINTKNDKGIGGRTYHSVNYGIRKVLIIPTQVRVSALRETFKGGSITAGSKKISGIHTS